MASNQDYPLEMALQNPMIILHISVPVIESKINTSAIGLMFMPHKEILGL
jgi:hypothetical protein